MTQQLMAERIYWGKAQSNGSLLTSLYKKTGNIISRGVGTDSQWAAENRLN